MNCAVTLAGEIRVGCDVDTIGKLGVRSCFLLS